MATPRRPNYYTGDPACPTSTFGPDDCLFFENLPAEVAGFYSLPRTGDTSLVQGDMVLQDGVQYVLVSNATINLSANARLTSNTLQTRFRRMTGSSEYFALPHSLTTPVGLREGDVIRQGGEIYTRIATGVTSVGSGQTISDSLLASDFQQISGGGGDGMGGAVSSVTGGRGISNASGSTTGAVTLNADIGFSKVSLFLGAVDPTGTFSNVPVELNGISTTFTRYTTNSVPYYFIPGIAIDSVDGIIVGSGVWATEDPEFTTPTLSNSFNLVDRSG